MLSRLRAARESESGFTLIELLVVIIIIGILAAIAIPVFLNQRQKGYDAQAKSDAKTLATLETTYMVDNGIFKADANIAAATADLNYRPSSNVTAAAVAIDTTGSREYCIKVTSASGSNFWYDSATGGLSTTAPTPVAAGLTCP